MHSDDVDFHIAGGTIASMQNASGLLVPGELAIRDQLASLGVEQSHIKMPYSKGGKAYSLDSIDLDMPEHGEQLLRSVRESLNHGHTPIVCGGTDAKIWYATLLTKRLQQEGFLRPGSGQRVIFVSSMRSVEEAPEHVNQLLKGAITLARAKDKKLSGGFAVCAEHLDGKSLAVHDVCDHFDKISSNLIYAFRSGGPVGYITGGSWNRNPAEQENAPVKSLPAVSNTPSRIAPPLLAGSGSQSILTYLRAVGQKGSGFDGAIIEGVPGQLGRLENQDLPLIVEMVRWLSAHHFAVLFNDTIRYDEDNRSMQETAPLKHNNGWNLVWPAAELQEAGALVRTGLAKDSYLELMLQGRHADERSELPPARGLQGQRVLGLRYVPDFGIMRDGLKCCAPYTKNLLLSALPNQVTPSSLDEVLLAHHKAGLKLWTNFEYAGTTHTDLEGDDFTEMHKPPAYDASSKLNILQPLDFPNVQALQHIFRARSARADAGRATR